MLKKFLIALGVLAAILVIFLGVVAMRPSDFRIARSATFTAPAPVVFEQVNDVHKWQTWSPWAKLDPNAKITFEGPESGKGASFHWVGNDEVGEGSMTITESRPQELVRFKLAFIKPFEDVCTAEFAFKPEGEKTSVTWTMYGEQKFIGKLICMFMDMDKMVGGDFEKGLANLKGIVEADPKETAEPKETAAAKEPASKD